MIRSQLYSSPPPAGPGLPVLPEEPAGLSSVFHLQPYHHGIEEMIQRLLQVAMAASSADSSVVPANPGLFLNFYKMLIYCSSLLSQQGRSRQDAGLWPGYWPGYRRSAGRQAGPDEWSGPAPQKGVAKILKSRGQNRIHRIIRKAAVAKDPL